MPLTVKTGDVMPSSLPTLTDSRRAVRLLALVLIAGAIPAACADQTPTGSNAPGSTNTRDGGLASVEPPPPIAIETLTGRHEFTDDVAAQFRLKPEGRALKVVNLEDPTRMAVLRITIQPGARFPWHTHPGPVMVAVTQGDLVYVYGDDCVERTYPTGTAVLDPGTNVHFAFNATGGETVLIATFLAVPATGPLTIPVDAGTSAALDAECGVAPAALHTH
jgi:quercetin dioxygenase-like cupin family protein